VATDSPKIIGSGTAAFLRINPGFFAHRAHIRWNEAQVVVRSLRTGVRKLLLEGGYKRLVPTK